ncbi:nucleotide disphospho-sugar-binding domain-containing protein [Pelagicoccus sp. SDUM812003]|uniref:glycosyltransferase n=1 Tax=Pelagicoccus sp. SDUM812003 TaxID=3041267 RepID=UPI0028109026|nr:nucleotide disphospho-sugar-binding domain-containing protein [Pelagicoccus sp. SDUM812003]MDQ8202918.1 glycosyltransferase [Pelagicoccus sp. SDUM812003]
MNTTATQGKPMRFLFTTWEGGGNVAPTLTVARKLADRGHLVRFMCDESARKATLEHRRIAFMPWRRAPNRPDGSPASCPVKDWEANSPQEGIQRLMDKIMVAPAGDYAQDLLEELDREPADLVVTSEMLLGVMAACESRDQRTAVFSANLCFYPFPGMPAFGPGLPPAKTDEDRALHLAVKAGTIALFDTGLSSYNATRLRLGLAPLDHVTDQINSVALFLVGTSEAFDFPVDALPEKLRYVGPQLDELGGTRSWRSPWTKKDQRPLALVGFSTTFQNHAAALQKVVDACSLLSIRALVTLGQIEPGSLRSTKNAHFVKSVSHDAVMKEAALVITHGGHGTVMRALSFGLPLLIIPHGRDQNNNAIRVVERGAGLKLEAGSSVSEIEYAIRRLIDEPSFSRNAKRLGKAIRSESEQSPVVSLLESLATQTEQTPCFAG